jgi:hypothetical protein
MSERQYIYEDLNESSSARPGGSQQLEVLPSPNSKRTPNFSANISAPLSGYLISCRNSASSSLSCVFISSHRRKSTLAEEPEYVRGSSPELPSSGVLAPAGRSTLLPPWRRAGAPMFRPAMPRSPIPRPLSAMAGWDHPAPGALSQDRSYRSAAKISVTVKVGHLSMGTESSYSILCSDACPAPNSSRYFR